MASSKGRGVTSRFKPGWSQQETEETEYRGRYADTSVEYAETLFEEQRERKRVAQKEQEEKAKTINFWDKVVKGGNKLINYRADKLEETQLPAKLRYQQYVKNAEQARGQWDAAQAKNQSPIEYLTDIAYAEMVEIAEGQFSGYELRKMHPYLREQARARAEKIAPSWEIWTSEARDVPTQEEFMTHYDRYVEKEAPRSIFGLVVRGIAGDWRKETPETRKNKMEKARDVLYGSPLYNEFTEFGAAMQTYNDFGIDTEKITSEVQRRIDAGEISLKMAGEITPVSRSWTDVDGVMHTSTTFVGRNVDNELVIIDGSALDTKSYPSENYFTGAELPPLVQGIKRQYRDFFREQLVDDTGNFNKLLSSKAYAATIEYAKSQGESSIFINPKADDIVPQLKEWWIPMIQSHKELGEDGKPTLVTRLNKDAEDGFEILPQFIDTLRDQGLHFDQYSQRILEANDSSIRLHETKHPNLGSEKAYTSLESVIPENNRQEFQEQLDEKHPIIEALPEAVDQAKYLGGYAPIFDKPVDLGQFFPGVFEKGSINNLYVNEAGEIFISDENGSTTTVQSFTAVTEDETDPSAPIVTKDGLATTLITPPHAIRKGIAPSVYNLINQEVVNEVVEEVDLDDLTIGQLKTLSRFTNNGFRDKLKLSEDISLRPRSKVPWAPFWNMNTLRKQAEGLWTLTDPFKWDKIREEALPDNFFTDFTDKLKIKSKPHLEELEEL